MSNTSALLLDYGIVEGIWEQPLGLRADVYEDILELRLGGDARVYITTITDRGHLGCLAPSDRLLVEAVPVPEDVIHCRRVNQRCHRRCAPRCATRAPETRSFEDCQQCHYEECPCAVALCFGPTQAVVGLHCR